MEQRKTEPLSALLWRTLPFGLFLLLTYFQGGEGNSRYYFYLLKTALGAALLFPMARQVPEMRVSLSWMGLGAGLLIAALWVGLDPWYPHLGPLLSKLGMGGHGAKAGAEWNPLATFGRGGLAGFFIFVRLAGSGLVVPFLEEVFFRSFVYRYLISADFTKVSLGIFSWKSFALTSLVFGLEHEEWLAGIVSGFIFQWLAVKTGSLRKAILAHSAANLALGAWVVATQSYQFW